jgi:hypothetical protein
MRKATYLPDTVWHRGREEQGLTINDLSLGQGTDDLHQFVSETLVQ